MNARDIAIRTILGEAANESPMGQAAVAHVLLNRARDSRWPDQVQDVALQPQQFSAWNSGAGGNDLVNRYGPGDGAYERAGQVYDAVVSGQIADPTGGATHYYSPRGMQALVSDGSQSNILPRWLQDENARRGGDTATIGGHVFTGLANGAQAPTGPAGGPIPQPAMMAQPPAQATVPGGLFAQMMNQAPQQQSLSDTLSAGQAFAAPEVRLPQRPQAQIQVANRDTISPYLKLFQQIRG